MKSIQDIKDAGFSHLKVELEAQFYRDTYDRHEDCDECDGAGEVDCIECDGYGVIGESGQDVECNFCDDGIDDCMECDGAGSFPRPGHDNDWCADFIREHVSLRAWDSLDYQKFYEDGSVDSEFTFTLPVESAEYVTEFIEAFAELGDEIGNGIDVDGAGMHIAVLQSGVYCGDPDYICGCDYHQELDQDGMNNFKREVTKLLPALFFVASPDHRSRPLEYRHPQVSANEKYSAIFTKGDEIIEYRLFETCYDKPEAFFDFLEAIAKTLRFYKDPSLRVKELGQQFGFRSYGNSLGRFYDTPEQLRALNASIKEVKPEGKSYKRLKDERGYRHTIESLRKKHAKRVATAKEDYQRRLRQYGSSYTGSLDDFIRRELGIDSTINV